MPPKRIPGTDKIVFLPENNGDYVIDLSNYPDIDNTVKQEDILIVGNWEDYSGNGTKGPCEVMMQGIEKDDAWDLNTLIDNTHLDELTDRGKVAKLYRQRNKLVHIE